MTRSRLFRDLSLVAAFAGVLMASSCAAPYNDGSITADPVQNHPVAVEPTSSSLKLPLASPDAGLAPDDEARLSAFVNAYLANGVGSISISAPAGSGSSDAVHYFGERLAAMGVPRDRILAGTHDVADGDNRVELDYIAYVAHTDPCGDWSKNAADTASNLPMPNFGCANQHNLAAMVADPRDLVEPEPLGPPDAMRRSVVMGNYQKGQQTAAQKSQDQSAAVSDIGR